MSDHLHTHEASDSGGADLVACPVMPHNLVDTSKAEATGLYRDISDQRYWLCCDACGVLWDANPEKYASAA